MKELIQVHVYSCTCNRCGHTWNSRPTRLDITPILSKTCPQCKSPYWDKDRVRAINV